MSAQNLPTPSQDPFGWGSIHSDGIRIQLLQGTDKGQVGDVIVVSRSVAMAEIAAGRAATIGA
jgi:hypothetical protein